MRGSLALWLAGIVFPALACDCGSPLSTCRAVASSEVVFIGTVESIAPNFLNRWNTARGQSMTQLRLAQERFLKDHSPGSLAALQDMFRSVFPDLPDDQRKRLENAKTGGSLINLFAGVVDHGRRARFRVRTVFRHGDADDDDAHDDDSVTENHTFDVWTAYGSCGYDFQVGETYLVYAASDEETLLLETDACSRTRRVTDAGTDLAYLYFYQDKKNPAGRLEGFATSNPRYQLELAGNHDPDRIGSPGPGLVIEMKSAAAGTRYTTSDAGGRFVFDGVPEGDYTVSAYAAGFPDSVRILAGPKPVHVEPRACASQVLVIPKDTP